MIQLKLVLAALTLVAAFLTGWHVNGWRWQSRLDDLQTRQAQLVQQQSQQYRALEQRAQQLTDQLAQAQAAAEQVAAQTQSHIQQEVARYAQSHHSTDATAARCRVDSDWVRLHNAAARELPEAASATGQPAAAPATLADALATVTHNYATANTCARRLTGWQAWYTTVKGTLDAQAQQPAAVHH